MGKPWLIKLGLAVTPFAIKWHLPFTRTIIRNTIFRQFVGGETLEETAVVAKKLGEYDVQVILDYGVEGGDDGEEGFDHAMREFIRVIEYAATQPNIPLMSIKVTGFARFGLLEKLDSSVVGAEGTLMTRFDAALQTLTDSERVEWERVVERMETICTAAATDNVGVLVDAEETWIQDPVDVLTFLMMAKFNREPFSCTGTTGSPSCTIHLKPPAKKTLYSEPNSYAALIWKKKESGPQNWAIPHPYSPIKKPAMLIIMQESLFA